MVTNPFFTNLSYNYVDPHDYWERPSHTTFAGSLSTDDKLLKQYKNCTTCYKYSMLFGGRFKEIWGGYSEPKTISSEEDFEIVKAEFVNHFNEKHRDIVKPKPIKSYKKVTPIYDIFADGWNMGVNRSPPAPYFEYLHYVNQLE